MTDLQIYLDTTVLVVFLFAKHDEPDRYVAVEKLFGSILRGEVTAVVSFYAFPELYGYVVDNFPQNVRSTTIRHGFLKLFAYPVEIATFVNRIERRRLDRKIDISDPADFLPARCLCPVQRLQPYHHLRFPLRRRSFRHQTFNSRGAAGRIGCRLGFLGPDAPVVCAGVAEIEPAITNAICNAAGIRVSDLPVDQDWMLRQVGGGEAGVSQPGRAMRAQRLTGFL